MLTTPTERRRRPIQRCRPVSPPRRRWRRYLGSYAFLAPNFLGFLVFTLLPVAAAFVLSFTEWDILNRPRFLGLHNFDQLLLFRREGSRLVANDPYFWKYLWNTVFLMFGIPLSVLGSLLCALLLNQRLRGVVFFRTLFFLPAICSAVAVTLLWKWIFQEDYGLLNTWLRDIGIAHPPRWLVTTAWAKPAFIIMTLWMTIGGYNCVLYLAGLQNIPTELYEAADMDGANAWHKLRYVTWPLLSPTTFFIVTMAIISGFQGGFIAAYMMTGGGPAGATTTIMLYIYQNAFQWFQMGYAAAIACVLFALIFGFTLLNWRLSQRMVHYQ